MDDTITIKALDTDITADAKRLGFKAYGECEGCQAAHRHLVESPTSAGIAYLCGECHAASLETPERIDAAREAEVREYGASNGFTSTHDRYCVVCHATLGVDNAADRCPDHTRESHSPPYAHCDACGGVGEVWDRQGDHGAILCCAKCRDGYELPECPDCAGSGYTREDDGERECIPCHGSGWIADD